MSVLLFIALHMEMVFKLKPIDVKAKESIDEKINKIIDEAVEILYESESCHLRFLFLIINSLLFQI
jgi:hypothetical protein